MAALLPQIQLASVFRQIQEQGVVAVYRLVPRIELPALYHRDLGPEIELPALCPDLLGPETETLVLRLDLLGPGTERLAL